MHRKWSNIGLLTGFTFKLKAPDSLQKSAIFRLIHVSTKINTLEILHKRFKLNHLQTEFTSAYIQYIGSGLFCGHL